MNRNETSTSIGVVQPEILRGLLVLLAAGLAAAWLVPGAGLVFALGLVVYALLGTKQSMQALSLLALLLLVSPGILDVDLSLLRWLILLAVAARITWDVIMDDGRLPGTVHVLLLYAVVALFFAVTVSPFPSLSALKATTFALGVGSILIGFYRTAGLRRFWLSWFFTIGVFIVLASAPLYGSSIGYLRNGMGFQGILNHPQTFGPVVASVTALLTGLVIFGGNRSRLVMGTMLLGWVGIYTSLARTAFLMIFGAFVLLLCIGFFETRRWRPAILKALLKPGSVALLVVAVGFSMLQWTALEQHVVSFLTKDRGNASVMESLQEGRSSLIEQSVANFYSAPLTGIGFGVPSDYAYAGVDVGPMGLPVSASTEKGFMPSAVLEETGITGAILVTLFIVSLIAPVVRAGTLPITWMMLAALLVNGGEMVFFSVGGMGLFFWMLIGFSSSSALAVLRSRRTPANGDLRLVRKKPITFSM